MLGVARCDNFKKRLSNFDTVNDVDHKIAVTEKVADDVQRPINATRSERLRNNNAMFFFNFQQAVPKMGLLDIKEGNQREVQSDCWRVN
ncbi:hypothetical protein ZIOFF_023218 [Zingiber officinale]|uniref:Uncharacterized protein n=1 Tax=Zingiber officinale TaxID=94328 RepID=A0A8J5HMR1_ZINOF|nr:hypothetical protein ZIOFF_023218 [Zingiber officinale]